MQVETYVPTARIYVNTLERFMKKTLVALAALGATAGALA